MKKNSFLLSWLLAVLSAASWAHAADPADATPTPVAHSRPAPPRIKGAEPGFSFGIKAGANMANQIGALSLGRFGTYGPLWGLNAGVFGDLRLNEILSFQPELNFTMKGYQSTFNNVPLVDEMGQVVGYLNVTQSLSFDYLELPLLLKWDNQLAPDLRLGFLLGPDPELLLISTLSQNGVSVNADHVNGLECGLLLGGELELDPFLLDVRYEWGLTSLFPDFPSNDPQNSVLSFSAGYRIE